MPRFHRATLPCREAIRHILDELDGRLSDPQFHRITEHLARCPNCSAYLDSLKKIVTLYRRYSVPGPPHDLKRTLAAALKSGAQARR